MGSPATGRTLAPSIFPGIAFKAENSYLTENVETGVLVSNTASASEVQKNFGAFHDRALTEPVKVTKYGRETVYIVSAKTYHEMKQAQRDAVEVVDLTADELALIDAAEIPTEHRYSLDE